MRPVSVVDDGVRTGRIDAEVVDTAGLRVGLPAPMVAHRPAEDPGS